MGLWGAIKNALNSTVGTSSFKPLNQLLTDDIAHVENYVATKTNKKRRFRIAKTSIASESTARTDVTVFEISNPNGGYLHLFDSTYTLNTALDRIIIYADDIRMDSFRMINNGVNIVYTTSDFLVPYADTSHPIKKYNPLNYAFGTVAGNVSIATTNFNEYRIACGSAVGYGGNPSEPENGFNTNGYQYLVLMPEPLRFENTLKIIIPSLPSRDSIDSYFIYTLDE